jgi:hypothetical protein
LDPARTDLLSQTQGLLKVLHVLGLPPVGRVVVTSAWRALAGDVRGRVWALLCLATGAGQHSVASRILQVRPARDERQGVRVV